MGQLNCLFVMPRLVQSVGDGYVFPLGIAYVSASLKKAGFTVFTLNLNHQDGEVSEIIRTLIGEHNIHLVGTGGLSPQYHLVKEVVESVKKVNESIRTVVGGGLISAEPEVAMQALEFADFGVIGEGEVTMVELARCLENGGDLSKVDGIIFKQGTGFRTTDARADISDLGAIPWPDYDGFELDKYLETPPAQFAGVTKNRMVCLLGSRSCPYQCTFCFHTNGRKYRQRPLDDFFAELDYLISRYNIEYINLADELFAPQLERAQEFCARLKQYDIAWYADFRIDQIKPELVEILKQSGLDVMFFGLESADNRILKSMRKGITIEQIEQGLKLAHESGIAVYGCFIFGDVEETAETAHNTLRWWKAHPAYNIHLTLVKPFPGSEIYRYACQKGIIKDPIQYLKDGCPQVNVSKMSDEEFSEIVRQISEAQQFIKPLEFVELLGVDPEMGRASVAGTCSNCRRKNVWENLQLFANDYVYCRHCGQKYTIPIPDELRENLEKNVALLLDSYGRLAIWGMTVTIMDYILTSRMLQDPRVFPVDISESKCKMNLGGKRIHPPSVLDEQGIEMVVISVPSHAGQIACQIKENHLNVKRVVGICQLVDPNPVVPVHVWRQAFEKTKEEILP